MQLGEGATFRARRAGHKLARASIPFNGIERNLIGEVTMWPVGNIIVAASKPSTLKQVVHRERAYVRTSAKLQDRPAKGWPSV